MDAIQLKMPEKIPRTEYSASVYWGLIRAVTSIPVDSGSGEAVKRRAMMAFEKAWDFGFTWSVLTGAPVLDQCRTRMGHAVYAEGGTDYDTRVECPFTEVGQVLSFDPYAVYGERNRALLTQEYDCLLYTSFHLYIDDDIGILFKIHGLHLQYLRAQGLNFPQGFRQGFYFIAEGGGLLCKYLRYLVGRVQGDQAVFDVAQ